MPPPRVPEIGYVNAQNGSVNSDIQSVTIVARANELARKVFKREIVVIYSPYLECFLQEEDSMGKIERYLGKIAYHTFRYLICPFLFAFTAMFLLFVVLNYYSGTPSTDYWGLVEISSIFSLLVAFPFFSFKTVGAVGSLLLRNKKVNRYFEERHPRMRRISIKTKIELKPFLLSLAFSMIFTSIAFFVKTIQTYSSLQLSSTDFWIFLTSYMSSMLFLRAYLKSYDEGDRAAFYLDTMFRRIDCCLQEPRISLSADDFEIALESYQKTLPSSYSLRNLREKVRQLQLVLDRGTKEEIAKVQLLIYSLSNSIKMYDTPSFDKCFLDLCKLLEKKQIDEGEMLQMAQSMKEKLQGFRPKITPIILEKVFPALVVAIVLVVIYIVFGLRLPSAEGG